MSRSIKIVTVLVMVCLLSEVAAFAKSARDIRSSKDKLIGEISSFNPQSLQKRQGVADTLVDTRNRLMNEKAFFDAQRVLRGRSGAPETQKAIAAPIAPVSIKSSTETLESFTGDAKTLNDIRLWFLNNQQANTSGLIVSHPDDTSFIYHNGVQQEWAKIYNNTQAFTYNQALAGIAMLKHGDVQEAKKIFDFYFSEWLKERENFNGFWTVYNVDPNVAWKRYEWKKGMGENAWIGLFALQYEAMLTGISQADTDERGKALYLATEIVKWVSKLPHHSGGIAIAPDNPTGKPNFGKIYSVENNLDYYALLRLLKQQLSIYNIMTPFDKPLMGSGLFGIQNARLFNSELLGVKNWLKTQAYDAVSGLFRTGGKVTTETGPFEWNPVKSLDVNSWAISAIGLSTLKDDFRINLDEFSERIGQAFALQDSGVFGGNILTAKGFDFADSANAALIGRSGLKWIEGTNQMILAYRMLADFYRPVDSSKAAYYQKLADHFLSRNAENAIQINNTLSYVYADRANVQIYASTGNWKTSPGQSSSSTGWVYLALNNINPFQANTFLYPYWDGSGAFPSIRPVPNEFLRKETPFVNEKPGHTIIFSHVNYYRGLTIYYVQIFNRASGKFEGVGSYAYRRKNFHTIRSFHNGENFRYDDASKTLTVNVNGNDKTLRINDGMPPVPNSTFGFEVVNRGNEDALAVRGLKSWNNKVFFEEIYPSGFLNSQNIRSVGNTLVAHLANGTVDVLTHVSDSINQPLLPSRRQHISITGIRKIIEAVTHPNGLIELKMLTFGGATESVVINTVSSQVVTRFVNTLAFR